MKNNDHGEDDKLAGENETHHFQDNAEHIETVIEYPKSSAPSEKGLTHNLMTLLTPTKDDTLKFWCKYG